MGWEKNCTNVRLKQIKSVDPFSGHFCIEPQQQQQQRSAVRRAGTGQGQGAILNIHLN